MRISKWLSLRVRDIRVWFKDNIDPCGFSVFLIFYVGILVDAFTDVNGYAVAGVVGVASLVCIGYFIKRLPDDGE